MRSQVNQPKTRPNTCCAPSRSVVLAGVTATPSTSPKVSTSRWRFRPFDPLAGVIAHPSTMTVGLDALAIENGGREPTALAVSFPGQRAQRVIEGGPLVVERPLPENVVDRLPSREVGGEIASRAATLDDIQDGIQDAPPIHRWAATFSSLGQHRLEVSPLGIRKTGLIYGVFHAPTEAPF